MSKACCPLVTAHLLGSSHRIGKFRTHRAHRILGVRSTRSLLLPLRETVDFPIRKPTYAQTTMAGYRSPQRMLPLRMWDSGLLPQNLLRRSQPWPPSE